MSKTYVPYRYDIFATWNGGGSDIIEIPKTNIANMIIDYDYDKKNMPIIYLICNLSKKLLDKMIKQKQESTIILNIKKLPIKGPIEFEPLNSIDYINYEFIYFIEDDVNYRKDVEYDENEEKDDPDDIYVKTTIGLLKLDQINNNKKTVNAVYKGMSITDIILVNTKHMPLLLEQPNGGSSSSELLIPPKSSISSLLKYIDDKYGIYNTPYRYFLDFDRAYILSSSGKNVQARDEKITSVLINIDNPKEMVSKVQGTHIDNSTHIIEIGGEFTHYIEDDKTDNLYNNIICIDSNGNKSEQGIDILKSKGSSNKDDIIRTDNLNISNNIKKKIELSSTIVRIIKNDIDSSVFTINKEYSINNFKDHQEHNGRFILSQKKEIYVREHENFIQNTVLLFRKLK